MLRVFSVMKLLTVLWLTIMVIFVSPQEQDNTTSTTTNVIATDSTTSRINDSDVSYKVEHRRLIFPNDDDEEHASKNISSTTSKPISKISSKSTPAPLRKKQLEIIHELQHLSNAILTEDDLDGIMEQYYIGKGMNNNNPDDYNYGREPPSSYHHPHYDHENDSDEYYRKAKNQYRTPNSPSVPWRPPWKHNYYNNLFHSYNHPLLNLQSQLEQVQKQEDSAKKLNNHYNSHDHVQPIRQQLQQQHPQPEQYDDNEIFIDGFIRPTNYSSITLRMFQYGDEYLYNCRICGGYSAKSDGGCCAACGKLKYDGCWCKSCDCLCYMRHERPIRWAGEIRGLMK